MRARKVAAEAISAGSDELDRTELIAELEAQMYQAAENLDFEKAARFRDRVAELKTQQACDEAAAAGRTKSRAPK